MTAAVKGWLLSLVAAALITALLDALTPEGIAKKVGRLLGGMLILLVIIRPVFALENTGLARLLEESPLADAQWDRALEEKDKILLEGLITGNCETYIEGQAAALGADCRVTVTCRWQDEIPVPCEVLVEGDLTQEQQTRLTAEIARDFEIEAENQTYREAAP